MAAEPLRSIPLVVLIHGKNEKLDAAPMTSLWPELQQELVRLSPQGKLIVAEGSGHFIQNDNPELIIEVIKQMVEQVREGKE